MKNLSTILGIGLLVGGGWFMGTRDASPKYLFESSAEKNEANVVSAIAATPNLAENIGEPAEPPEGHVQYVNEKYGFSYWHAPESTITEYDEGGGAMTIVHENAQKMRGLQIFIVPYKEKVITEERFEKDVPSGVRLNIEETSLGYLDIPAVTFNSYDEFLGETREVWFIYNGYLYEVTTFKGMGDWFGPIMKTWRFIRK
jgi:hypothetical protein